MVGSHNRRNSLIWLKPIADSADQIVKRIFHKLKIWLTFHQRFQMSEGDFLCCDATRIGSSRPIEFRLHLRRQEECYVPLYAILRILPAEWWKIRTLLEWDVVGSFLLKIIFWKIWSKLFYLNELTLTTDFSKDSELWTFLTKLSYSCILFKGAGKGDGSSGQSCRCLRSSATSSRNFRISRSIMRFMACNPFKKYKTTWTPKLTCEVQNTHLQ
mgnify:CR=1 FL=1